MISRRIIRTKVLQVLYAYYTSPDKSINQAEKELFFSLQKTYDLYHYILQLPVEIADYASSLAELRKRKHFPTPEDLHPNLRFVNNPVIQQLRINRELRKYLEQSKIDRISGPELIKKLYNTLVATDFFPEYMESSSPVYTDHRRVLELMLGEVILQSDDLSGQLEEQSIYWNDDLDFVVSMAIKTLKKFNESSGDNQVLLPFFKDEEDREYAQKLFRRGIMDHQEVKKIVEQHTMNWDVERIAAVDELILELAIVEFINFPSIPTKVTMNEYIELSKYYSTQKSRNFINGILDKVLKSLKKEDKIIKTGRGLIGEINKD